MKLGCIILASGRGERFGSNKLLEKLNGRPLITYTVAAAAEAAAQSFIDVPVVVTRWKEVEEICRDYPVRVILHEDPDQSDSVRHGITSAYAENWDGCMFVPGDQPLLVKENIADMAQAFYKDPERAYCLSFDDAVGSPRIFPRRYFKKLAEIQGDRGGGFLLKVNGALVSNVSAGHPWELWDVDTEEDLERIRDIFCILEDLKGPDLAN